MKLTTIVPTAQTAKLSQRNGHHLQLTVIKLDVHAISAILTNYIL